MNIDNLAVCFQWKECLDPNFNWDSKKFYRNNKFNNDFYETFKDKIKWEYLLKAHKLSEKVIDKYVDFINLNIVNSFYKFSEEFLNKHFEKINRIFSVDNIISEDFIEKNLYRISDENWTSICCSQKLSEAFIEKYKDKVDWEAVSYNQKLSEAFIEKYKDKVDWYYIFIQQHLSKEFKGKYRKIYKKFYNRHIR